jgi:hypothetical protein
MHGSGHGAGAVRRGRGRRQKMVSARRRPLSRAARLVRAAADAPVHSMHSMSIVWVAVADPNNGESVPTAKALLVPCGAL